MKLRCLLGLHGPWWTMNDIGMGPYSVRVAPMYRQCPHCKATWGGNIYERHQMRYIGCWERVKEIGQ